MLQATLICAIAAIFLVLERAIPGRELPESPGWYARAAFLNACQLGIVLTAGVAWNNWFHGHPVFGLSQHLPPWAEGLFGWFIGTFVFYWWHRARHDVNLLW